MDQELEADETSCYKQLLLKYDCNTAAKLCKINTDIMRLHQQAQSQGFGLEQIRSAAEPLLKFTAAKQRRSEISFWWLCTAVAVSVIMAILCYNPTYRLACSYTRLLFIKTLPYWDWTVYYKEECLIKNPYYEEELEELYEEDCKECAQFERVERIANVSQSVMSENFLKRDIPVIITDATDEWPSRRLFSLNFLHSLYEKEDLLKRTPPCSLTSSIRQNSLNIRQLLAKADAGEVKHWFAHWENCDKAAVRLLRRFYRRPYFIPPMVEAIDRNWMLLSSGYSAKHYKPLDISSSMMWIAQLQGEIKIRLIPRHPCNVTCSSIYAVLHEGETVVWTDFLWMLEYLPLDGRNRFNVAIASGGSFD